MHLNAAHVLTSYVTCSAISKCKTRAILGETLDIFGPSGEDEDLTEVLDGSGERKRLLKQHMLAEAKSFRELELLSVCLDQLETVASLTAIMKE